MNCPLCAAEFVDGIDACSDCHVPLVRHGKAEPERLGPGDEQEVVARACTPSTARTLSEAMNLAGVPFRLCASSVVTLDSIGLRTAHSLLDLSVRPIDEELGTNLVALHDALPSASAETLLLAAERGIDPVTLSGVPSLSDAEIARIDFDVPDEAPPEDLVSASGRLAVAAIVPAVGVVASLLMVRESMWWWAVAASGSVLSGTLLATRAKLWREWRLARRDARPSLEERA